MAETITRTIDTIVLGDMLHDLDNGYVVDIEEDAGDVLLGRYSTRFGEGLILLTMHDAEGDEFYLIAPPAMEVRVRVQ